MLVCFITLPITPITYVYKEWWFGAGLCYALPWVQGVSVTVSTLALAAIAIDRYIRICRIKMAKISHPQCYTIVALIWCSAIILIFPYAIYMKLIELDKNTGICGEFCTENWPNSGVRRIFSLAILALQFVLPFAVIVLCYCNFFQFLSKIRN